MESKRFDMSQIEPKAFCGKVNQATKIANLDKRWTDMKYAFVKDGFKAHKRFLQKKNKNIETITKDLMKSKPQFLNSLLRKDPEIYNLCEEKTADDLIEAIEGLIFEKRKRLDRLNFKLNKLKEEYYLLQIDIKQAKEASKHVRGDKLIRACQDAEVDLQNLRTEKETALIVLNSYKKLLDVLHRDSEYFDTIILRYKAYILLRAEFAFYILKLLKWAIFDAKTVEEASKITGFLRWEVISKQTSEMEAIKSKISRIRSKVPQSLAVAAKEFDIYKAQQEQFQQFNMSLQYIKNKWDDYFEAIRDSCRVSKDSEILTSIENALQDKYYLLKQIEINNLLLDNYSRRKNYLQQTLETLMYTTPDSTKETERRISELKKEKKKLEKEHKKVDDEWSYMPKVLHSMYQTMFNLNHFLKLVASPPHNIYKLNREIYLKFDPKANKELDVVKKPVRRVDNECQVSNEQMPVVNDEHFIISQREREMEYPVGYGEKYTPMEKFDYLEEEYRVPHVFDSIFLKVKLLLRQLGNRPEIIYKKPTKRQQRAFRKYIQSNGAFQFGPGIAIETEEEEDEGEREEKDELENLLLSMWSKGGKIGRR